MIPLHPSYFPASVTFHPPGTPTPAEARGDPVIGGETAGAVAFAPGTTRGGARVGPSPQGRGRSEEHLTPEGTRLWSVETPSDPGCATDWRVTWGAREFRTLAAPATDGVFALWLTECCEVT